MSVVEPITSGNSTTGAGAADSWHSVATAIEELKTAHGGDRAAIAAELGIATAGAVLDTVAFAIDPFAKVIAAGLGWLIEHISFLRWPLDQVAGDPDRIKVLAEDLHKIGETLRNAAADMDSTLKSTITQWQGAGFDSFSAEMTGHRTHVDDAGHSVDVAGYVVETTMALVAAVRALIRDIITTLLGDIISTMLVAVALAPLTFGASIATGVTKVVAEGAVECARIGTKLAGVAAFAGRVAGRLAQLGKMTKAESAPAHTPRPATPASTHPSEHPETPDTPGSTHTTEGPHTPPPASTHADEEDPFDTWLRADAHFNPPPRPASPEPPPASPHTDTPPASPASEHPGTPQDPPASEHSEEPGSTHSSTADEPPAPAPPQSYLKPQDISVLKKHEDWLKSNYQDGLAKVKFVDDFIKNKYPDAYPMIKALADAKSSKNWVGWADKNIITVDKQLTDIQAQADAAWQESDQQWRARHPDPAAADGTEA